jgi:hypothetical protein
VSTEGSGGEVEIAFEVSTEKAEASSSLELSHRPDHAGEVEPREGGGGGAVLVLVPEVGA